MANSNGWGDGASNNNIGWGKGADNAIGWGSIYANSWAGATDIVGTPAVDPDAQAFITAASITDPTQQSAINTLVTDLKGYSIWTKMKAIYPFVGGTSTSTSYNLVNTALYQISWSGGVTWGVNGVQFGGVNGYGNTGLKPSTIGMGQNSQHLSFYSRTNSNGTEIEIGAQDATGAIGSLIEIRTSGTTYYRVNSGGSYITYADANSLGFYTTNRTASNVVNGWKNGTKVVTGATISSGNLNADIWIGAWNNLNGAAKYYSNKQCAFASIGDGLTDIEASNFYTAVQAFQTTLARQV